MNRIDYISSLTNGYKTIADVGCDHAFISINAVEKYNVELSYALDINDGPLENARMNIAQRNLKDKIKAIKSDGLISLNEEVEAIVIAGMGGGLIAKIISDSISKANSSKALILSPNSDEAALRLYLMQNSFEIVDEKMIEEKGHYYEIIIAIPNSYKNLSDLDISFGPVLRREKSDLFKEKYSKKLSIYEKSLSKCNEASRDSIMKNISILKEVL